jgi:copper(I)-binding protein
MNEEAFAVIRASSGKTPTGRLLLGVGVLALLVPAVAGCEAGSNAPTLEFHPAAPGAQTVFHGIKITNAFVLGAPSGSTVPSGSSASLFVSLYNGGNHADTLQSMSAPGSAASISVSGAPVSLPVNSAPVNLTGPQPKVVLEKLTKPLSGGSYVPVVFDFARAGSVTLQVPVEAKSYFWSTYSAPPPSASSGAAVHSTSTATPLTTPAATGTASPTSTATPTGTATP